MKFIRKPLRRCARGLRGRLRIVLAKPWRIGLFFLALAPLWGFGKLAQRIVYVIDQRLLTFHELEMYEGDMALHAIRVLNGQELYPSHESDYIPLLYTPLYSYLFAGAMKIFETPGEPHAIYPGRFVSLWATTGILLILFLWVVRETGSLLAGLGAAGLFYSINPLVGWWFDIARVDMAHVFFVAAGTWAFMDRRSGSERSEILKGILAGFFFTCGFFTKQTAGQIALGMTLLAFGVHPLRAFWGMVSGATLGGVAFLYCVIANTDFFYLCVTVPSKHFLDTTNWHERLRAQYFYPAGFTLAIIAAWTYLSVVRRRWRHVLLTLGLAWTTYFCLRGAITVGGYLNHYLPGWFFLSLCAGIGVGTLISPGNVPRRGWIAWGGVVAGAAIVALGVGRKYEGWWLHAGLALVLVALGARGRSILPSRQNWRGGASVVPALLWGLLAMDMAHHTQVREFKIGGFKIHGDAPWQAYDTRYRIPQELDGAKAFIEGIRRLDGPVWIPHANYYAYLAGRPTDISTDHVRDINMAGVPPPRYVIDMINQKKYKYILLNNVNIDHDWQAYEVREAIKANYELVENWDAKYGWQALKPVDMTAQKPRALLMRKDMIPRYQPGTPETQ